MKDTVLFDNKWVTVIERELENGIKWTYGHHTWCKGRGIVILPFRRELTKPEWNYSELRYLGRVEICPSHSPNPKLCAVAGGMDVENELPAATAVRELFEETGYIAKLKDIIPLGDCRPSKGTDTQMYMFAVDVTDLEKGTPSGDGSMIEQLASTAWVNKNQAMYSQDPLLATMVGRLDVFLRG